MLLTRITLRAKTYLLPFFVMLSTFFVSLYAQAHEITPTIINLKQLSANQFELQIDANLEALMVEIGSEHEDTDQSPLADQYDRLRALPAAELSSSAESFLQALPSRLEFTDASEQPILFESEYLGAEVAENDDLDLARESLLSYKLTAAETINTIALAWPESLGESIFRVEQQGVVLAGLWTAAGERSDLIDLNAGATNQSLLDYVIIGFEHILPLGLDHTLFVIGIYLLSQKLSALLWQVSAFTLAHTITLALATLGWVNVSPSIVEPLIAASISYVAIENLFHHRLSRGRVALVFGFGLLHGLGFAGVLSEIGLNQDAFIPSLIAFNIGVELGQLAVILGMFLLLGYWFAKTVYWESFIRRPLSILIALVGAYWFVERVFL